MKVKLTESNIPLLEARFAGPDGPDRDKADAVYWDTEIVGFGLRFRRSGKRTFVLQYKLKGVDNRMTLGQYPGVTAKAARAAAQIALGEKAAGKDPQADRRAAKTKTQVPSLTLRAVIDNFLAYKQNPGKGQKPLRPASLSDARRYLMKDWKPLHGWPIAEIQLRQVAGILEQLEKTGSVAAARSRSHLMGLYKYAMERGLVTHNPVIASHNPDPKNSRKRVLTDAELCQVWNACQGDNDYNRIVRLLVLTGQRRTEIGGMCWSELNLDKRAWTIPGERTKNGETHTLVLPQACWSIIEGVERRDGIDQLFGYSNRGYQNWGVSKKALDERCPIPAWVHHDLRRTVATRMAESSDDNDDEKNSLEKGMGIQPHVIEALLNHTSGHKAGVAGIYNRSAYTRDVRNALISWADYIASIVSGEERKILQFPAESAS